MSITTSFHQHCSFFGRAYIYICIYIYIHIYIMSRQSDMHPSITISHPPHLLGFGQFDPSNAFSSPLAQDLFQDVACMLRRHVFPCAQCQVRNLAGAWHAWQQGHSSAMVKLRGFICGVVIYPMPWEAKHTSSTAQGGGGSSKIGHYRRGELLWMAERIHWWAERWLELCFLEWSQWLRWSPHPQLLDVVWCSAAVAEAVV